MSPSPDSTDPTALRQTGGAYTVGDQDAVKPLLDLPQSSVGAPLPCILAGEHFLSVAFLCEPYDPDWDGTSIQVMSPDSEVEDICAVQFQGAIAHYFGLPNDEAFGGHPLAARGLEPYSAFEITSSSWIVALERMNSVHPCHRSEHFADYKHFVLSFHDTTFECVARGYSFQIYQGSLRAVIRELTKLL